MKTGIHEDLIKIKDIDPSFEGEYQTLIDGCFQRMAVKLKSWNRGNFSGVKGNMKFIS